MIKITLTGDGIDFKTEISQYLAEAIIALIIDERKRQREHKRLHPAKEEA